MPLPLFIPIIIGFAGLRGVWKTVAAGIDNNEANNINDQASGNIGRADRELKEKKAAVHSALEGYGQQKLNAMNKHLAGFVELFSTLKNVELTGSADFGSLKIPDFTPQTIKEFSASCQFVATTLSGLASGVGGGALIAFGAYNGTIMLAAAGTGTAISSLGGIAATNATLAWLGGGTLASGGLGIAGGTCVLGVLVAGPALLIFGSVLGAKAEEKLANARTNYEESKLYATELGVVTEKLRQILEVALLAQMVLSKFTGRLRRANQKLKILIEESGTNYAAYTEEQKHLVFQSVKYAQILKALVDIPLLTADGELDSAAHRQMKECQAQLLA